MMTWQSYADFGYQMENWVRWTRVGLGKPPKFVVATARLEKEFLNYIEKERKEPIYEKDAMQFDSCIIRLPRRQRVILKLHYLDHYIDHHGIAPKAIRSLGHKLQLAGVGKTTFYNEIRLAEAALKRMAGFDRELENA